MKPVHYFISVLWFLLNLTTIAVIIMFIWDPEDNGFLGNWDIILTNIFGILSLNILAAILLTGPYYYFWEVIRPRAPRLIRKQEQDRELPDSPKDQ